MSNGSSGIFDSFTDNFVITALVLALFLSSLFFISYNLIIIFLLIAALFIGYIIGFKRCKKPGGKKDDKKAVKIDITPEKEYELLNKLKTDYEKLMTERTNVFLLVYTFLFAAFFQLSTISSSGVTIPGTSTVSPSGTLTFTGPQIIYIEYILCTLGFLLALIHFYILSDTGQKYREVDNILRDIKQSNAYMITANLDKKTPIIRITDAYRVIPFLILVIWLIIGVFLVPGFLNVKNIFPIENTFSEVIAIILFSLSVMFMSVIFFRLFDRIAYGKQ